MYCNNSHCCHKAATYQGHEAKQRIIFIKISFVDCQTYYDEGFRSDGVYSLSAGDLTFNAWCEFDDDRGWTYIQRRQDGNQSFDLGWEDYKLGFGDIQQDFWLGK